MSFRDWLRSLFGRRPVAATDPELALKAALYAAGFLAGWLWPRRRTCWQRSPLPDRATMDTESPHSPLTDTEESPMANEKVRPLRQILSTLGRLARETRQVSDRAAKLATETAACFVELEAWHTAQATGQKAAAGASAKAPAADGGDEDEED